jgi:hypothetical protein
MNWRVVVLGLTGVTTALTAIGRFEAGKTGFLLCAPIVTSILSFSAVILMWRVGSNEAGRNRT